jgi:hypothetical protein
MIVNSWTVLVNMFFVVFAQIVLANKVGSWKYKKAPGRGVPPLPGAVFGKHRKLLETQNMLL